MKLDELNLSINDLSCDSILDLSSESIIVQITNSDSVYRRYKKKINLFLNKYGGKYREIEAPVFDKMRAVLLGVCLHDRFNAPLAWISLTDDDTSILIGAGGIEIIAKGEELVTWEDVRRELIYSR